MSKRKEISFSVNKEDIRKIATSAVGNVLDRFKDQYLLDVRTISQSLSADKGSQVIKDIEKMLDTCHVMAEELNDLVSLIQEIKEKVKVEED